MGALLPAEVCSARLTEGVVTFGANRLLLFSFSSVRRELRVSLP